MFALTSLNIPLDIITKGALIVLMDVVPYFEYEDGKRTEKQLGYKYTVVEMTNYEKFQVKVPSASPVITSEKLQELSAKPAVTFDECFARPYRAENGSYNLSFSAKCVHLSNGK